MTITLHPQQHAEVPGSHRNGAKAPNTEQISVVESPGPTRRDGFAAEGEMADGTAQPKRVETLEEVLVAANAMAGAVHAMQMLVANLLEQERAALRDAIPWDDIALAAESGALPNDFARDAVDDDRAAQDFRDAVEDDIAMGVSR